MPLQVHSDGAGDPSGRFDTALALDSTKDTVGTQAESVGSARTTR